ncbi:MAG: hypothetical protein Q4A66_11650, partial [Eubacteriales bacterium]|nr:hypothetical protein [Eubacteriales bacterium]
MAEKIVCEYEEQEACAPGALDGFFGGIAGTLKESGTPAQRILCAMMMAVFALARLPGGGYCAQAAMFAVLLHLGFAASSAFIGVLAGFLIGYVRGDMALCSQLLVCVLLWLSCALWARPNGRLRMAAAVLISQLLGGVFHTGLLTGSATPLSLIVWGLSAAAGAALCLLYDGAALSVSRREELDGETRPLCAMAVLATFAAGLLHLPYGAAMASSMALYLTLEHAYVGGAAQAILCAGVLGGVVSLGLGGVNTCAMLLTGGFLAGEIKTRHRSVCAALMLSGMAAASALLGGTWQDYRLLVIGLPGALPCLLLPISWRKAVTGIVERPGEAELTQSEAIAVRCASMIHAWAHLYEDTAKMMQGLCAPGEDTPLVRECVQLLHKTSAAAHQVCERTLGEIRPDDEAYRRVRYALVREGLEQVRPAYALRVCGRREVMLIKPEHVAASSLEKLVSSACGAAMRARVKEGLLCTQAVFEQEPALALEIGAAARSRSGEEVAGDSYL